MLTLPKTSSFWVDFLFIAIAQNDVVLDNSHSSSQPTLPLPSPSQSATFLLAVPGSHCRVKFVLLCL